jgi:hypothetical protein
MQEPLRTPLFDQNPKKIEKQQVEMATETVKKKEVNEELSLEETAKRIAAYLANAHRIKDKFEPVLRKIWPDIDTITVYELIEDVKNLDFEGCDCLIKLKDGTKIHAALRENAGGIEWYTQASMLRRNSVRRHEGKAIQSIEIQIFKENNQIHILDSDEVYKIANEFQKHNKLEGYCEKLDKMAKERNIFKYKFYKYANWVTKDSENPNPPEREDAIRIKYIGYENFTNLDNVPQTPKVVEVLHKWEKYTLEGHLIEKGSQGVDLHCEEYKEKTKALEAKFPVETRLAYEKEKIQEQTKEKIMTKIENIDPETIQPFKDLDDICVGYDPKAEKFAIFDERTHDVWAEVNDIDELNDILDDKIIQLLAYSSNDQALDIFEELEGLEDSEDTQEKKDKIKELKGDLNKLAGEIAETIDLEELEIQAAISRERHNGDSDSNEDSDSNGDSRTLI